MYVCVCVLKQEDDVIGTLSSGEKIAKLKPLQDRILIKVEADTHTHTHARARAHTHTYASICTAQGPPQLWCKDREQHAVYRSD